MSNSKPRLVKDYEKLTEEIRDQIKLRYPEGFIHHLISFTDKEGASVSAIPLETDDIYYLVRMTKQEAATIIEEEEDYNEGYLREDINLDLEEKPMDFEDIEEDKELVEIKDK